MRWFALLLALALSSESVAAAEGDKYGDWWIVYPENSDDILAASMNESGNLLAFRCFSDSKECVHALRAGIRCQDGEGDGYPVLVNSDAGPMSMSAYCSVNGEDHELILSNYDLIHGILSEGTYVGFAIPMSSGLFKVVRFSLSGCDKAMRRVKDEILRAKPRTKDEYL